MTAPGSTIRSSLYATLLGDAWCDLADAVRRLHELRPITHAAGVFRVRHGNNRLTRALARLTRLPPPADDVDVQLLVAATDAGEEWRRSFSGRPLVSTQSARPDGRLAERIGAIELRLRLKAAAGDLHYETA